MKVYLCPSLLFFLALTIPSPGFSAGGEGATCTPITSNWGSCNLAPVPFADQVTSTILIPGGTYAAPFVADQSNTEYILQGDITADGTAISITANHVIINLDGHTITFNETIPGEGVTTGSWNRHHISVRNGSIIQGAAGSGGTDTGAGNNPVSNYSTIAGGSRPANNFHIANLYTYTHGHDVAGIWIASNDPLVEQNSVEDNYPIGELTNRHQGIDAIGTGEGERGLRSVIRNNSVINARHRGIAPGNNSEIYGNKITVKGIDSNSCGVFGWQAEDVTVYNNTIHITGPSPIGIAFTADAGTPKNATIYGNDIYAKTTALNKEYSSSPQCFTESHKCGMNAIGIRVHGYGAATVGMENLEIMDNTIHIDVDSWYRGTYAPTGEPVWVYGKGKGMSIGIKGDEEAHVYGNRITVLDKDGTGEAYGVSFVVNESDGMYFYGNVIKANVANVVFGDLYSYSRNYPLVYGNKLIKVDNFSSYATFANKGNNWSDNFGRAINNSYEGGASEDSVSFTAHGPEKVDVYFGYVSGDEHLYTHRYHDDDGTSSTIIREDFTPPITLPYRIPEEFRTVDTPPSAPQTLRLVK